ncbi:hypothetical protein SAICODRAFT_163398 [Saitoella complicata NRRL Y-17804]|nr:uncharacterized protein SAICODRAFT_163398 [Saitoella complicata NRRL Y-17804]ODQ50809.1 hypothetical protein SAICODRAFT_163398 [Saitoella complicata NRRL Y-17804]
MAGSSPSPTFQSLFSFYLITAILSFIWPDAFTSARTTALHILMLTCYVFAANRQTESSPYDAMKMGATMAELIYTAGGVVCLPWRKTSLALWLAHGFFAGSLVGEVGWKKLRVFALGGKE